MVEEGGRYYPSEKDAKLVQKLGQLQPFVAVFPPECMGHLGPFGPTSHLPRPTGGFVFGMIVSFLGDLSKNANPQKSLQAQTIAMMNSFVVK